MMKRTLVALLFVVISLPLLFGQIDKSEITINELSKHINILASDSLKGRYPGTIEDKKTADYISSEFSKSNLFKISGNYFQTFQLITNNSLGKNNQLSVINSDNSFKLDSGFSPFPFSANANVKARVVFVGYGFDFTNDTISWNDYKGIDVKDKWVIILRNDPQPPASPSPYTDYVDDRYKVMLAYDKGAKGVFMVNSNTLDEYDFLTTLSRKQGRTPIPAIHIKRSAVNKMLKQTGKTISDFEKERNSDLSPASINIPVEVEATTDIIQNTEPTYNIIGAIEGNHPVLREEYIVIGAHYDHLGVGGSGTGSRLRDTLDIHHGADDNASGVAAVIELAEKLAANRDKFHRSILFVAFGAEEKGLLGSKYFVNNPPVNIKNIKAMINLDMIGRMKNNTIEIGGTGTSDRTEAILEPLLKLNELDYVFSKEGYGPSDHSSFYGKDIPVFFISTGAHMDYHTPDDTPDKIDMDGLINIASFVYDLSMQLTTIKDNLVFKEAGSKTGSQRGFRGKITLGFMPDFTYKGKEGVRAEFITPGKPGYKGGMKNGDVILGINGNKVGDIHDYMYRLAKLKAGQTITVEVLRENDNKVLIIQL